MRSEIWVAAGTYKPSAIFGEGTESRDKAFMLIEDVKIFGGFIGTETSIDQRDWNTNVTILSGDLDNNGYISNGDAYHVVVSIGEVGTARLDGFTVTGGNANGYSSNGGLAHRGTGGGIFTNNSAPTISNVIVSDNRAGNYGAGLYFTNYSSPTITNVTVKNNTAAGGDGRSGAGIVNNNSTPTFTNVTVVGNFAENNGGGMFNTSGAVPTLNNVTISGNYAGISGGGIFNYNNSSPILNDVIISENIAYDKCGGIFSHYSSPMLNNVTIIGNSSGSRAGGMCNENNSSPVLTNVIISGNYVDNSYYGRGGGMHNASSSPILTNVIISGNLADFGGGMFNEGSFPILTNVTISGNSANEGGGMYNYVSSPMFQNTILWGNNTGVVNDDYYGWSNPTYNYCLIQDLNPTGEGNLNGTLTYPNMFVNAMPHYNTPTTGGDYHLAGGSPCIDAGNNSFNTFTTDLGGGARVYNGIIDMGAYEFGTYYTVSFDSQGGSPVQSVDVQSGSIVPIPNAPDRIGYNFHGWFKETNCVNAWIFDTDVVTYNITLFAKWIIKNGIDDITTSILSIYPNPATHSVSISGICKEDKITIMDLGGRIMTRVVADDETQTIGISNLTSGVYILRVESGELRVESRKLVVQ